MKLGYSGVILETEGSVQKIQKRALFHYKIFKKGTPNLISPYVHGLFTVALMKQIFEKNKSLRAASDIGHIHLLYFKTQAFLNNFETLKQY